MDEGTPFHPGSAAGCDCLQIVGQLEKLASISQADPRVAHFDVVLALLVSVCFPRERRAPGRHAPSALGFGPRRALDFGSHRPSSTWTAPNRSRYMLRGGCLCVARLSAGYFFASLLASEILPNSLIFVHDCCTNSWFLILSL